MKNTLWLIVLPLLFWSCAGKRMIEASALLLPSAGAIKPAVLVVDSGKIHCDYVLHIGSREFDKNMVLKITPKLVYKGGELADSSFYLQGQRVVLSDYPEVKYKKGIDTVYHLVFDYKEGAENLMFVTAMEASGCGEEWWSAEKVQPVNPPKQVPVKRIPVKVQQNPEKEMSGEIRSELMFERAKTAFASSHSDFIYIRENLDKVLATPGAVLTRMEIVVSCSPEGPVDLNKVLVLDRYNVAKEYLTNYFNLDQISFFHQPNFLNYRLIPQNWQGLYDLIEDSRIADKYLIIARMKQASEEKRQQVLWGLMEEYPIITNEYLPLLRRADFIFYYKDPYKKLVPTVFPPVGNGFPVESGQK